MSAFVTAKTQLRDLEGIRKALMKMGWNKEDIHLSDKPVKLNGYHSTNRTAELFIRKENLGGHNWNDLGFKKQADGSIQVVGESAGKYGLITGKTFQKALVQNYALAKIEDELEAKGFFLDSVETRADGKIYVSAENPYL